MDATVQPQKICVIGSANVDLIFQASRFPQPGETLTGRSFTQCMGGKGANQAVAAARLGARVSFIACVGNDPLGSAAIAHYRNEGIATDFIRTVDNIPTGTAAIVVDDRAENCIIVVPGANASLSVADVQRAAESIREASVVVSQLETPLDACVEAFRLARQSKRMTMLTPAPVVELANELLELCDVCIPNRTEIEALVGMKVSNLSAAQVAVSRLLDRGVATVALTMGSEGVLVGDRHSSQHIPAVKVQAVDTTGAGDAFSAALAVFLSEGRPLFEAAKHASLVAAISVTRPGTQSSFPYRAEI